MFLCRKKITKRPSKPTPPCSLLGTLPARKIANRCSKSATLFSGPFPVPKTTMPKWHSLAPFWHNSVKRYFYNTAKNFAVGFQVTAKFFSPLQLIHKKFFNLRVLYAEVIKGRGLGRMIEGGGDDRKGHFEGHAAVISEGFSKAVGGEVAAKAHCHAPRLDQPAGIRHG